MQIINFNIFVEEIISGKKTQTIRKPKPIKIGEQIYFYTNYKNFGEATCIGIVPITLTYTSRFLNIDIEFVNKDGFKTIKEFEDFILNTYFPKDLYFGISMEFIIIYWDNFLLQNKV